MIGHTISHYRILEKIGAGGMGEVYLAEDTELQRRVAIKFLPAGDVTDPDVLARFKREAQAAASLDHNNIITIYEVGDHEGRPYIAMAYVEGDPLSRVISRGSLTIDRALELAMQIAEGLGRAHQAGVVHRDIKPDNILVDRDGNVKILDFGLAKLHGVTKLTNEASTLGTLYYMSPEQAQGAEVDHRSDLFSLGTVLFEMVTGRLPFQGDHAGAVTYAITTEEPQPLARFNNDVTPELQRIVSKLLAKDPGERYQSAADLVADLRRERRLSVSGISSASTSAATPPAKRRALRFIIPASIVGVAALLVLVFKPFTFEIAPDQPVVAAENTLAIMYFDNMVDPGDEKRLGEIVTNLLITDLSESASLKVLSSQRLYDILKLEGKEGLKSLDRGTSTAVARRAGAKWMLLGNILQIEPDMVVTSQLVEVATGGVESAQRVTGAKGDNVFSVVEKLGNEIKSDLSVPVSRTAPEEEPRVRVSTNSTEAYRYYLEGREYDNKWYRDEARASYRKAIAIDSTFAMAYFRLSNRTQSDEDRRRYAELALRFSDDVTEYEKEWIETWHAEVSGDKEEAYEKLKALAEKYPEDKEVYEVLGMVYRYDRNDVPSAIQSWIRAIEIDPLFKAAYNYLAYAYHIVGNFERSIWAINKYIELAPDEPNPYDSRGDLYAMRGKVDDAIASYKKALEIEPDFETSRRNLATMYRAKRDYAAAESEYRRLLNSDSPNRRSQARTRIAGLLAYQGKLARALEQFDLGIAADRIENNTDHWGHYDKFIVKAQIHDLRGENDEALAVAEELPRRELGAEESVGDASICELAALSGDFARAERIAGLLNESLAGSTGNEIEYHWCEGAIAFARARFDEAIDHYRWLSDNEGSIWDRLYLARAYQGANRLSEAVREYEAILTRYDWSWRDDPVAAATMHYYAGTAYEMSGWNDKAIERYEDFVTLWKDADPGIEILEDAKRRLERLKQGS